MLIFRSPLITRSAVSNAFGCRADWSRVRAVSGGRFLPRASARVPRHRRLCRPRARFSPGFLDTPPFRIITTPRSQSETMESFVRIDSDFLLSSSVTSPANPRFVPPRSVNLESIFGPRPPQWRCLSSFRAAACRISERSRREMVRRSFPSLTDSSIVRAPFRFRLSLTNRADLYSKFHQSLTTSQQTTLIGQA